MTELQLMLNVVFTLGAVFSVLKVKETLHTFGFDHGYSISFILHAMVGRVGFSLLNYPSLPANGATQYFAVVSSMTGLWMGIAILGVCALAVRHLAVKYLPLI